MIEWTTLPLNNFHAVRVRQPYFPAKFYEVLAYLNKTWLNCIEDLPAFQRYHHIPKEKVEMLRK
jgi:hypothetical protein